MRFSISSLLIAVSLLFSAHAAQIKLGLGSASNYNLITQENAALSGADSQGIIAVGGNAEINHYDVGTLGSAQPVLQVDGNLSAAGDQIIKGDAIVKGTYSNTSSSQWHNPIPTWRNTSSEGGIDISETFANLTSFSEGLASLNENTTLALNNSLITFTANRDPLATSQLFVSSIGLDDLNSITGIAGELFNKDDHFVLNIFSEKDVVLDSFDVLNSLPSWSNILFNFVDAEKITLNEGNIHGSILAPNADFFFDEGLITGGVYVNSFTSESGAQLNFNGGFTPGISVDNEAENGAIEVTAPNTFFTFLVASFLLVSRRSKQRKSNYASM